MTDMNVRDGRIREGARMTVRPAVAKWIYVVGFAHRGVPAGDDNLNFKHAFVDAMTELEAYDAGFKAVRIEADEQRVNDCVIRRPR